MVKAKILVVDDDRLNLKLMKAMIAPMGYEVLLAQNGEEALEMVQEVSPDLILLDIMMPGMDGFKVARKLKEKEETRIIPLVMVTALWQVEDRVRALKAGADDFLSKPVDKTELMARIQSLVRVKAYHDEIRDYQKRIEDEAAMRKELLEKTLNGTVGILTDIIALVSPMAFSRSSQIRRYVRHIVTRLKQKNVWQFELAAMLSQLGCVTIPPETLEKVYLGERLSAEEEKLFGSHPSVAEKLLARIPGLEPIAQMIGKQQEPVRGQVSAYDPRERDIVTLGARVLKVALGFDQRMNEGMEKQEAIRQMLGHTGQFDSAIVRMLGDFRRRQEKMHARTVNASDLRTGMILAEAVYTEKERLLAIKGQEVSYALAQRLRNFARSSEIKEPFRVLVPL